MTDTNLNDLDAGKVDSAMRAISESDFASAKRLLMSVIANAPMRYEHQSATNDGSLVIRFWDQQEFIHYVNWTKPDRQIFWHASAYPRAFFYLGFIAVGDRDYNTAIAWLDKAYALEPSNPKIALEKAQALMGLKRHAEALNLFKQASAVGPFTSGADAARGLRGQGFVLIELGRHEEAEDALKASLKLDPNSDMAKNELLYLARLKAGGPRATLQMSVVGGDKKASLCAVCGKPYKSGSIVESIGTTSVICDKCKTKSEKKPWQFWK